MELTPKTSFVRVFPFAIYNFECDIFIWRARMEPQNSEIDVIRTRFLKFKKKKNLKYLQSCYIKNVSVCTYQRKLGGRILVDKIRVKYIEFITLDDFRRRVVHVVMGLVIFVPFESSVHSENFLF